MLGYSEEEVLNLSLATQVYADPSERIHFMELLRRNGRLQGHELTFRRKDGSPIRLRLSAVLTSYGDEAEDHVEAYVEDMTSQSALEQQVRAVQKLEAVGRLAGGVAHDFNNILVVIKLSTEMMLNQITPDSPLSKPLPGIGGQEMARQLGDLYPDVRVLFTSGYTQGTVAQMEMLQEGSSFLPKPDSVADLSSAIHRILALRSVRNDQTHADLAGATSA